MSQVKDLQSSMTAMESNVVLFNYLKLIDRTARRSSSISLPFRNTSNKSLLFDMKKKWFNLLPKWSTFAGMLYHGTRVRKQVQSEISRYQEEIQKRENQLNQYCYCYYCYIFME